jgi:hypothetical protein
VKSPPVAIVFVMMLVSFATAKIVPSVVDANQWGRAHREPMSGLGKLCREVRQHRPCRPICADDARSAGEPKPGRISFGVIAREPQRTHGKAVDEPIGIVRAP